MTANQGSADFSAAQRKWESASDKRSPEWGRKTAESLWTNLYQPWIESADGRSFLDVGCSWGYLFQYMLDHCSPERLVGVDVIPHWKGAPFDWENETAAKVDFRQGDVLSAALTRDSFDYVLCAGVFQYLPPTKLAETLQRMRLLLRVDGEVLLRTQVFTSYLGLQLHRAYLLPYVHLLHGEATLLKRLASAGRTAHGGTNWLTATSYLSAFSDAGFEILDVRRYPNQHSPAVQNRVLAEFPVSREEMTVSQMAARLRRI